MVQFRWIKVSLFVMLLLQFTAAVTGQNQAFTFRVGDDVTLPCGNVMKGQDKCNGTTWIFSRYEGATVMEVVTHGRIRKHFYVDATSGRLSVTEKCSLLITNVTVEDVGRYTCKQFNKSGEQQGPDSHVHLSVVTIDKYLQSDSVVLACSVLTYSGCGSTVKWLYDDDKTVTETSQFGCSAMMTFSPHLHQKSNNVLVKCKVTDDKSGQTLLSPVSLESSGDKTGGWLRFIIVSVSLAALIITVVAVDLWIRTKGKKTQTYENISRFTLYVRSGSKVEVNAESSLKTHSVTNFDSSGCENKQRGSRWFSSAAVTGQNQTFTVRVGDDVTLPCGNVMKGQDKCDGTTWIFSRNEGDTAVELVTLGQIMKHWIPNPKSDRLSVTEKCSLLITNVTEWDVGRYTCKQFNKSGKQQSPDSHVHLSVVNRGWLRFIIMSASLAALIITVVAVDLWMRTKGKKTQTYENLVQAGDDAVTYSTVKALSLLFCWSLC
ncbi:hypothetical protein GBF38_006297 [Nibea albiflora]|uniref:Uncharacterized protein n=1 Tax=Nibea albiflora TaxID=240163 RepID=A0ACB7FAK6_NIBAL|nr:hypothetical protein GBF38_006297 [Nibea albiflora]